MFKVGDKVIVVSLDKSGPNNEMRNHFNNYSNHPLTITETGFSTVLAMGRFFTNGWSYSYNVSDLRPYIPKLVPKYKTKSVSKYTWDKYDRNR
ncbi:MAG: hypothetical protein COB41_00160 [Proteobacteria bacterium]|nr:MAG: hypothetical protein COB41_00160 [Pseudomonadota bacterium]